MNTESLWQFLALGYAVTVMVELPILYIGLSAQHSQSQRIQAGFLLTAFTYPVVVLVLPAAFTLWNNQSRIAYLIVAETYAPVAEVLFFRFLTNQRLLAGPDRDMLVIAAANLCSFLLGEAFLSDWILGIIRDS